MKDLVSVLGVRRDEVIITASGSFIVLTNISKGEDQGFYLLSKEDTSKSKSTLISFVPVEEDAYDKLAKEYLESINTITSNQE